MRWRRRHGSMPMAAVMASVHAVEIGPATAAKLRSILPSSQLAVTVADFEQVMITPAKLRCGVLRNCAPLDLAPSSVRPSGRGVEARRAERRRGSHPGDLT